MGQIFRTASYLYYKEGATDDMFDFIKKRYKRVLLVTGKKGIMKEGWHEKIINELRKMDIEVFHFHDISAEPDIREVQKGLDFCRKSACDCVIALGGGSALDAGKLIAGLVYEEGNVREFFEGKNIKKKGIAFIPIPTTTGTGSEATPNSVVSNRKDKIKKSIRSPLFYPEAVVLDPIYTYNCPFEVLAYSAIDAFVQGIECIFCKKSNVFSVSHATQGLRLIYENFEDALLKDSEKRKKSREKMLYGSYLIGVGFGNSGLGMVHGMAHPVGIRARVPHGAVCGLILPYAIEVFRRELSARIEYIERNIFGEKINDVIERFCNIARIKEFLPLNIDKNEFEEIIKTTLSARSTKSSVIPTREELKNILEALCS